MLYVELDKLIVSENRQRREFDDEKVVELSGSIRRSGLINPIAVRAVENPPGLPDKIHLVAGERRLRAIKLLAKLGVTYRCGGKETPLGYAACMEMHEMDEVQVFEAELEENIRRKDLTWQEAAKAIAQLEQLRNMQRGDAPQVTAADLAEEVHGRRDGSYQGQVREQLIVARHLNKPEVQAATSLKDALKALKRTEGLEKSALLAASVGATFSAKDHTLMQGNCLELLKVLEPQFDCLLTDPPYGMGADEFGDSGGKATGAHDYSDDLGSFRQLMALWIPEVARVMLPQSHVYQFCDLDQFHHLRLAWELQDFKTFRTPLIWFKPGAYRAPWPHSGPQRKYECILYAVKNERPSLKLAGDVLTFNPDENLNHHAQKPVALFRELLSRTCNPGDRVLDCYCGSGPIFPAGHGLKVRVTGMELDPAYAGISAKRIQELL
jgi:DNA modification methylase